MGNRTFCWILDSGGAGRGAWQGGVIHQFMRWSRERGCYPSVSMGASAGGYAAGDVATGTGDTVMKGWTHWGREPLPRHVPTHERSFWGLGDFRLHLMASIRYVMAEHEMAGIFDKSVGHRLLLFTSRVRRLDGRALGPLDVQRLFLRAATRKLPRRFKYLPGDYLEDPVVFASHLPSHLHSEYVRPLTPDNYHRVILASCLVPLAMGDPLLPGGLQRDGTAGCGPAFAGDRNAVFIDGGYTMKMPMAVFEENPAFHRLNAWAAADKTVIFCCDPEGVLWETSFRLRSLNSYPSVSRALSENRMLLVYPDHKIEAGFLCVENDVAMRTFRRGQEQADRLLRSDAIRRFFEDP